MIQKAIYTVCESILTNFTFPPFTISALSRNEEQSVDDSPLDNW